MTGGAIAILTFTFHPDWYVGATVVPPRTLGGQEVAGRGVEPVPVLGQLRVTDGLASAHTQVVVEAPLRLARDDLVLYAGVTARDEPEGENHFNNLIIK